MGQTIAKTAKQVTPMGGTFVVMNPDTSPNIQYRWQGILDEMQSPEGIWEELTDISPILYDRDLTQAIAYLQHVVQHYNPTLILITSGGPLFHSNYTTFYQQYVQQPRRNITIVCADDFEIQQQHLSRGHVQGLVGQIPYEMGYQAAQILYRALQVQQMQNHNNSTTNNTNPPPLLPDTIGTNLITHVHVPLVLPDLHVDHNLIGPRLQIVGYMLWGTIVGTAILCGLWTYRQRKQIVVQAAQPIFLILIAVVRVPQKIHPKDCIYIS
jgi:hypothetical protein